MDDYYEERYQTQQSWYSDEASWNKKWYYRAKGAVIVLSISIPIAVSFIGVVPNTFMLIFISILSFLLLIAESSLSLFRFQENWLNFRSTSEALKKEGEFFKARVGPYSDEELSGQDPKKVFIERVEELISQEHRVWRIVSRKTKAT